VVWHDHSKKDIRGQRFDASGASLGAEIVISAAGAGKPDLPAAALAGDGSSYIVLYEAEDGEGNGVFAAWVPLL
jgi:hypothetical protein